MVSHIRRWIPQIVCRRSRRNRESRRPDRSPRSTSARVRKSLSTETHGQHLGLAIVELFASRHRTLLPAVRCHRSLSAIAIVQYFRNQYFILRQRCHPAGSFMIHESLNNNLANHARFRVPLNRALEISELTRLDRNEPPFSGGLGINLDLPNKSLHLSHGLPI
jgi:hypothetical protein